MGALMAKPYRSCKSEFERLGAYESSRDKHGCTFTFRDRRARYVRFNITDRDARNLIGDVRQQYGNSRGIGKFKDPKAPRLDMTRLRASEHAKSRLVLMQRQQQVSFDELVHALVTPVEVRYSGLHESWIWCGHRVAVAVALDTDGSPVITTVLWATRDLWDASPRPEKARTNRG